MEKEVSLVRRPRNANFSRGLGRELEPVDVNEDAVLSVFPSSAGHEVARHEAPEFFDGEAIAAFVDDRTVHPRLAQKDPGPFLELIILGKNGGSVKAGGCYPGLCHPLEACQRGLDELGQREVGRAKLR